MSYDLIVEDVPQFIKRVGDRVIEGSNNSTMVFGTDRSAPGKADFSSGYGNLNSVNGGKNAGSWHVMCGRTTEHPNFVTDSSYAYLSMRSNPDTNLQLENIEFNSNDIPTAILKSSTIRIVGRKDIKVIADKTYLTLNGLDTAVLESPKNIFLGSKASHPLVLGDSFMNTFNSLVQKVNALVDAYNGHVHQSAPPSLPTSRPVLIPFIPSGAPPPAPPFLPASPAPSVKKAEQMPSSDLSNISKTK